VFVGSSGTGAITRNNATPRFDVNLNVQVAGDVRGTRLGSLEASGADYLYFDVTGTLTADRTILFDVNDINRTITLTGNPTLADWFNQSVKVADSPTFVNLTLSGLGTGLLKNNSGGVLSIGVSGTDYAPATHKLLSATHQDTIGANAVLGDLIVGGIAPSWERLDGNTTATKQFLSQTGTGGGSPTSNKPIWVALVAGDIPNLTQYIKADGTVPLTADWDAGSFEVRAQTFESDVVTGTAPLVIASTTLVTNLNADLLDGSHASAFALASHVHSQITVANEAADATCFPLFVTAATGDLGPKTNAALIFDSTTGKLGATTFNGLGITATTGVLTMPNGVTLTGPAASGTAMTLGNAETVTGAKTFSAIAVFNNASPLRLGSGGSATYLIDFDGSTADGSIIFEDVSGPRFRFLNHVHVTGNLSVGFDITITGGNTIDGRDVSVDGTTLDSVKAAKFIVQEANATLTGEQSLGALTTGLLKNTVTAGVGVLSTATAADVHNTGTATIDFGNFPGASDASFAVTGQTGIASGSIVQAWLRPTGTDTSGNLHTADEYLAESIRLEVGNIVAGTGFTIYGINTSQLVEPVVVPHIGEAWHTAGSSVTVRQGVYPGAIRDAGGQGTRIHGSWTVQWRWS
jgi:hypothetical protein